MEFLLHKGADTAKLLANLGRCVEFFVIELVPTLILTSYRLGYFSCASFLDAFQLTKRLEEGNGNLSSFPIFFLTCLECSLAIISQSDLSK